MSNSYKKVLEGMVLRRKEEIAAAGAVYSAALKSAPELYDVECKLRRLRLGEIRGGKSDKTTERKLEAERKSILAGLGITEMILNPPPKCKKCGDTGLYDGRYCDCVKRQAILSDENINLPLHEFKDADPQILQSRGLGKLYQTMTAFCQKFPATVARNIILLGSTGTGKTYLASCVAGELTARGFSVVFLTAFAAQQRMLNYHTKFDAGKDDYLSPLLDCDLLIIDDLGTESLLKNITLEYLYIVINERSVKNRHTVITSNLSMNDMAAKYGQKLVSRLFDKNISLSVVLEGYDLRKVNGGTVK